VDERSRGHEGEKREEQDGPHALPSKRHAFEPSGGSRRASRSLGAGESRNVRRSISLRGSEMTIRRPERAVRWPKTAADTLLDAIGGTKESHRGIAVVHAALCVPHVIDLTRRVRFLGAARFGFLNDR
jgi:hypothetical protein